MNRHDRRRAQAQARGRRTGFLHRIMAAHQSGGLALKRGTVSMIECRHDPDCAIYRGRDCSCVPEISVSEGNSVMTIDEDGNTTRGMKS